MSWPPFSAKLTVSKKGEQLMRQPILPLISSGANKVSELLSIVREDKHTKCYMHRFSTKRHDEAIRKSLADAPVASTGDGTWTPFAEPLSSDSAQMA